MDRLPLALKMNPGLDGLYAQTFARSEHLPHFLDIISTIALLEEPLPTSGIAELLGMSTYKVVDVLVNLQAIIQVPGTDDIPVTLFHTSLRDFLTTQSRSGRFFAHPRHHVRLFLRALEFQLVLRRRKPDLLPSECNPAGAYALQYPLVHSSRGEGLFELTELDSALQLYREALRFHPGTASSPELTYARASVTHSRARLTRSLVNLDEAISLYREAIDLYPSPHPYRSISINKLGSTLMDRYRHTRTMADLKEAISLCRDALEHQPFPHPDRSSSLNTLSSALLMRYRRSGTKTDVEEAISLYREAVDLRPSPDPHRSASLNNLGNALRDRYLRTAAMADLEESIALHREALELCPSPHPGRSWSLDSLGTVLLVYYQQTQTVADLEEGISLHREALELRPHPHPHRASSLTALTISLHDLYNRTHTLPHLQEAIFHCEELLAFHYPAGHQDRVEYSGVLTSLLEMRFDATGQEEDLARIARLEEEEIQLSTCPSILDHIFRAIGWLKRSILARGA
ncbi:hypothetical protein H1R20_g206, partial [Candolleomyces eurysporus]